MQDLPMKWLQSWDSPVLVRKKSDKLFPKQFTIFEKENVSPLRKNVADMI